MTILGKHTIDETRHLIAVAQFRINRTNDLVNQLPYTAENVQLVKDWNEFVEVRWKQAHALALEGILGLKLANPLVPEHSMPAETQYMRIVNAMNKQEGLIQKGDLTDFISRFEAATDKKFDSEGQPVPEGWDPDLAAYQEVDATIKAGEKIATEVKTEVMAAAKSYLGLTIGLGLGAVALVVGGTVLATKVYL